METETEDFIDAVELAGGVFGDAGVTEANQKAALDVAVVALKAGGGAALWPKLRNLLVPCGGDASKAVKMKGGAVATVGGYSAVHGGTGGCTLAEAYGVAPDFDSQDFALGAIAKGIAYTPVFADIIGAESGKLFAMNWTAYAGPTDAGGYYKVKGDSMSLTGLGIGHAGDTFWYQPPSAGFLALAGSSGGGAKTHISYNGVPAMVQARAIGGSAFSDTLYLPAQVLNFAASFTATYLTPAELTTLHGILKTLVEALGRTGYNLARPRLCLLAGNSIGWTTKEDSTPATTPIYAGIRNGLGLDSLGAVVIEHALNGQRISQYIDPARPYPNSSHILAMIAAAPVPADVVVCTEFGINDIAGGRTSAQIKADFDTYGAAIKTAGARHVVISPYSPNVEYSAICLELKALFLADPEYFSGNKADAVVFLGDIVDMTNPANTWDGIHVHQAPADVISAAVAARFVSILAGQTQTPGGTASEAPERRYSRHTRHFRHAPRHRRHPAVE